MRMVGLQGWYDTLNKMSSNASDGTKVIFLPTGPGAVSDMASEIRNALISGTEAAKDVPTAPAASAKTA